MISCSKLKKCISYQSICKKLSQSTAVWNNKLSVVPFLFTRNLGIARAGLITVTHKTIITIWQGLYEALLGGDGLPVFLWLLSGFHSLWGCELWPQILITVGSHQPPQIPCHRGLLLSQLTMGQWLPSEWTSQKAQERGHIISETQSWSDIPSLLQYNVY